MLKQEVFFIKQNHQDVKNSGTSNKPITGPMNKTVSESCRISQHFTTLAFMETFLSLR